MCILVGACIKGKMIEGDLINETLFALRLSPNPWLNEHLWIKHEYVDEKYIHNMIHKKILSSVTRNKYLLIKRVEKGLHVNFTNDFQASFVWYKKVFCAGSL